MRAVRLAGLAGLIGWGAIVAAGCASGPAYTPRTYVVQPRDTLYSIAWRHDLDYRNLARWNHLGTDYRITVGQVLLLKPDGYRAPPRGAAHAAPHAALAAAPGVRKELLSPASAAGGAGAPVGTASGAAPSPEPSRAGSPEPPPRPGQPCGVGTQSWRWPTSHASPPRPVPGGGVLLLGSLGQPIRAACAGRVVYAGSGIRGYGNLIIIKHGETLLSAYAHTIDLTVREGQAVAGGEEIARMGTRAHGIAALYFEIRVNGKPVDPLPLLPAAE